MKPLVDDFFIFRFNTFDFTSFKDTCLKTKSFASMFEKHTWIFLILKWFLKKDVIWFMSVSKELLNGFRFSFLVKFMKNLFTVLEITLSFVMIPSFLTSAILLEFDLFLQTWLLIQGFTDFQKLLLSITSLKFTLLKYCFFDFLRRFAP